MREYRGKAVDGGEWVYGSHLSKDGKSYIVSDFETLCNDGENTDLYAIEWYEVDPETVGQYTGLQDRNGKEIYEGDLVKAIDEDYVSKLFTVVWNSTSNPGFGLKLGYVYRSAFPLADYMEVIGNSFDNPSLLEAK